MNKQRLRELITYMRNTQTENLQEFNKILKDSYDDKTHIKGATYDRLHRYVHNGQKAIFGVEI